MSDGTEGVNVWFGQFDGQCKIYTDTIVPQILDVAVHHLKQVMEEYTPIGNPSLWNYPAPKGYVPGTLKASWEIDKKSSQTYVIKNEQPYAYRVETGWSTQAPAGMMRRAILSWPAILKDAEQSSVK